MTEGHCLSISSPTGNDLNVKYVIYLLLHLKMLSHLKQQTFIISQFLWVRNVEATKLGGSGLEFVMRFQPRLCSGSQSSEGMSEARGGLASREAPPTPKLRHWQVTRERARAKPWCPLWPSFGSHTSLLPHLFIRSGSLSTDHALGEGT